MDKATELEQLWKSSFPSLVDGDSGIIALIQKSRLLKIEAQQKILSPGSTCKDYLLVAEGSLRVQFYTRSGRKVVLYHVKPGEDCVLTTSCIFSHDCFPAEGVTETEMSVIAIPTSDFHQTLQHSIEFRTFVFSTFGKRLAEVIARMEILCSSNIEQQLAKILLVLGKVQPHIEITHQELASEVGSVREVISRQLKKFENQYWIKLGRGKIEILDKAGLKQLISG